MLYATFTPDASCVNGGCTAILAINLNNKSHQWGRLQLGYAAQLALADDGRLFMLLHYRNDKCSLVAVNVRGDNDWSWDAPKSLTGQMIVTPNAIIMNANTVIYIISRNTHALMGFIPAKSSGTMAVAGNVLYVTDDRAGTVTAVKLG